MKKRRKVLSVMLCAAMIASLAACGSKGDDKKSSDDGGKVKLTFSTSVYVEEPHQKAIDALLEAYSKKEPNVEIEILGAGYDGYWDNITTEILSNNESDMIQVYPENISTYNAIRDGGTFMDLSEYMSDDLKEKLVGQDMCDVDGQTLAISSYAWGTTGIFYRKSMLKDAGVNPDEIKTQEDFRKACKKFTDDGKYAMGVVSGTHAFTVSEWNRLIARPVSNGLYFPNGESEPYTADNVNINAPENVWAAQWWQDFILKDKAAKLVTDKKDSREMFWNGDVPFNMDGPWFVGMCKERDESLMDDIGIIPQFDVVYDGTAYKPNPTNYPLVTMISKNCKHPKEAYAFLEWMTTDEAQITNSTSVMMTTVAGDDYSIGYVSLGSLDDSVKALKIDGAEATAENIKAGKYKVSRPFNIAVKKDMKNEVAKDFINYVMSEEGQKIVSDNGYIPVDGAKPYSGKEVSGKVVVGGSSSVSPVMEKLIEGYKAVNSKANVELQTTDSTTGMTSTIDGSYDIGMASRDLKDDEAAKLQNTVIATDGIAVIVNKNNTTDELSADQVKSIYTGDATTWDEVVK